MENGVGMRDRQGGERERQRQREGERRRETQRLSKMGGRGMGVGGWGG